MGEIITGVNQAAINPDGLLGQGCVRVVTIMELSDNDIVVVAVSSLLIGHAGNAFEGKKNN